MFLLPKVFAKNKTTFGVCFHDVHFSEQTGQQLQFDFRLFSFSLSPEKNLHEGDEDDGLLLLLSE